MSGTNVARGSSIALTQMSVALSAQLTRAPGNLNALTGPMATGQSDAEAALKQQSAPEMPFVRITDLSTDPKGDKITVDAFNVVGGKPIMGDKNAEGMGQKLSPVSFDMIIDLATFNVDAGGKMSRQRTRWDLRRIAKSHIQSYFPQLIWQRCLVHAAGARGSQNGVSWNIPLSTDADFSDIMINTVKAPTYNRHLVIDGGDLVHGGAQLASVDTTDKWRWSVLDSLALRLEAMETKLPPPRLTGDEQAYDAPLKGILYLSPGSYNDLITDTTSGNNLREFLKNLEMRTKWAKDTALFRGECGIWRGLLIKKMEHSIQFASGETGVKYITQANRLTETESSVTVASIAGYKVERAVLLGAQALARAEGTSNSGVQASIIENTYNAGRSYEYLGEFMGGERKFRFSFKNENGDAEPTDNGVFVIDAVTKVI